MPILTIAFPTYNRAEFLDRCLKAFSLQIPDVKDDIQVLISNNASSDNTRSVINAYRSKFDFAYFENKSNLGPDPNIAQCFEHATGKYFWVFGDDDLLREGALIKIIGLLKRNNYGCVHLSGQAINEPFPAIDKPLDLEAYHDSLSFYRRINYWTTFITGNIINREIIKDDVSPREFFGSQLNQLSWIIPAIFKSSENVIIKDKLIASEIDNNGGYKLITTFSKSYNQILKTFARRGYDKRIIAITNENLIRAFFPYFIPKVVNTKNSFEKESGFNILLKCFWNYKSFWKYIFPLYVKAYLAK